MEGEIKFAGVAIPNPRKWEWSHGTGLTSAALKEEAARKAKAGFRPASVTGYAFDGAIRYCAVWVKETPKK